MKMKIEFNLPNEWCALCDSFSPGVSYIGEDMKNLCCSHAHICIDCGRAERRYRIKHPAKKSPMQLEFEAVLSLPNCNDCGNKPCAFRSRIGERVVFNCPLHEPKEGEKNE